MDNEGPPHTRPCPGGCGTSLPMAEMACWRCWERLPGDLKMTLWRAIRMQGQVIPGTAEWRQWVETHVTVYRMIIRWFGEHPPVPV